ncbi:MAG TPA: Asp-tRNA(Asn)/Glu-tRNA(Gln) amidotransferase GatCAB subunit B, partial [Orrella sp.]
PEGQTEFGTRTETKNVNSFRFLERAILFEVQRQIELIEDGGTVVQETRLYDADRDETRSMRSKEDAHDYRYFPDPDLPPLVIDAAWIEEVRADMPELPGQMRDRFVTEMGLTPTDAAQLCQDPALAQYFEAVAKQLPTEQGKLAANWLMGEMSAALNRDDIGLDDAPIKPDHLAKLLTRIIDGTVSNKIARDVFAHMWSTDDKDADAVIEAKGLKQISDSGAIGAMVDEVIANHDSIVQEYRAGKQKAFNSLVGQVMKLAKGKANPAQVNELLKSRLDG